MHSNHMFDFTCLKRCIYQTSSVFQEKDETDSGYRSGTIPDDKLPRQPSQATLNREELKKKLEEYNTMVPGAEFKLVIDWLISCVLYNILFKNCLQSDSLGKVNIACEWLQNLCHISFLKYKQVISWRTH